MTKPVELRVGGQTYRVVSSASADDLERLACVVDEKLASLVPAGRPLPPQAVLLAAIALARDVEVERARGDRIAARSHALLGEVVARVDRALEHADGVLQGSDAPSR